MAYTSRVANELLATPFDDKSNVSEEVSIKLTEEEFCEHCYSHPLFEKGIEQYLYENIKDESNDSTINYEDIENQVHQQITAYKNFELWLDNFESKKVYTINGNAGTGKTTFINYKRYKETKVKWIILDIHLARSFDEWMPDIRTDILHFEKAQSKVYGSIMNRLWEMVFQGLDKKDNYSLQIVYDTLIKLTKNYKDNFADQYPSGRKLLDAVCKVMDGEESVIEKVEAAANLFKYYVNGKCKEDEEEIIGILNIFLLVLRCLSDEKEERYIILFDNFERFIAKDELYNRDVDRIRLLLISYAKFINQRGNIHRNHFKFIMTIRDSTARMCGVKLHASDAEASNLDLEKWYDTKDIISLKKDWYKSNNITIENSDLVEQITGDSRMCLNRTITGLKLFIDPLFNDNKRLIIDFIGSMVELPSNKIYIDMYKNLWNEDTELSRFAARSIIRGLILNDLENKPDKLFEHLKTYSTRNKYNGIGDARKILTILFNNIQKGNKNEMSLNSVLSELFGRQDIDEAWNESGYAEKRKSISEILFYMNSYNRRENDWIQFIDLQHKNSDHNIVIEDADRLEQLISVDMNNCVVHLMPAGKAYLMYIVASFEFFSLRYISNYAPLFTLIPTPEEIVKYRNIEETLCYKKIKAVIKYTEQCIDLLQKKEDTIKLFIGNSTKGKFHYTRIIEQHKAYIDAFVKYVESKYCSNDNISELSRKKYRILCKKIISERDEYNKWG